MVFDVPILYLAWKRIDSLERTFPEIARQKPRKLFIACDGPRNKEEKKKTDKVRKYILDNINWKCEVKTLFRDKNLGCKMAVSGAIDWFFENVDEGIILEEDCLPSPSFFKYCREMLSKYRDEDMVMSISGQNSLGKLKFLRSDYIFSKFFFCWGWATWKDSWEKMDLGMSNYDNYKGLGLITKILYSKRFSDNFSGKVSSWATSFLYSHLINRGLCAVSKNNLIQNIGFSEEGTHMKENYWDKLFLGIKNYNLDFPLRHKNKLKRSIVFDLLFLFKEIKRVFLRRLF